MTPMSGTPRTPRKKTMSTVGGISAALAAENRAAPAQITPSRSGHLDAPESYAARPLGVGHLDTPESYAARPMLGGGAGGQAALRGQAAQAVAARGAVPRRPMTGTGQAELAAAVQSAVAQRPRRLG